jgi:hypothetical protein
MWPRYCEMILALWLALSSPYFGYCSYENILAPVIALISGLNFRYRYIHSLNSLPAYYLIASVYLTPVPFPANQNYLIIALLLLVLAYLPPHINHSPREWEKF